MVGQRALLRVAVLVAAVPSLAGADPRTIASLDLSAPFATRSAWRLEATQGPDVPADRTASGGAEPGAIRICISRDEGRSCQPDLSRPLRFTGSIPDFDEAHELEAAKIVHLAGGQPLLLLSEAGLRSGDGDQGVVTTLLAYDRRADRLRPIFRQVVGHNRNQEVRFIEHGPLTGLIVSAEPTADPPFGYWIAVSRLGTDGAYRQVLRFRSATHYGDGNRLAVIDSEMPGIEARLGLWQAGAPLPLPDGACPHPHLVARALWCDTAAAPAVN